MKPKNLTDEQREAIFRKFGQFVDSLDGNYVTAEDSGTKVGDMNVIHRQTEHVLGHGKDEGGPGDPSPYTAFGVRRGIEAAVEYVYDRESLDGVSVAIQGVGNVGYRLADELDQLGADLVVTDINRKAVARCVEEFGAEAVEPDAIFDVECDIFAPCALGAVLSDDTIPRLECDIVAGSANNQLAKPRHDAQLKERGILYAPDYLVNSGGLIYVADFYDDGNTEQARARTSEIYDTLLEIFDRADSEGLPTGHVADQIAEERIQRQR